MNAKPATTFNKLITRLNEIKLGDECQSELELARLKREADKLRTADPVEGLTALGIIACFEDKIADMHHFHQAALALSQNPIYQINYAISLTSCGIWEDALKYAKLGYERCKNDPALRLEALDTLLIVTHLLSYEEEFLDYATEWEQLTGEPHELFDSGSEEDDGQIEEALERMDDAISENKVGFLYLNEDSLQKARELTNPN